MKLDEIARLAGVSRTTASYVINGKAKQYRVSDKTIDKVMAIVKKYNFQPNAVAAGLRAGRTFSIGLIIPDLENTSYTRIANHLERLARKKGYQLLISCSEDDPEIEMQCIRHLHQRRVDALIISSASSLEHPFYQDWNNKSLPIFALDRALDSQHFMSVVGSDCDDAQVLATEFKKSAGKNVVYLGALPDLSVSRLRESGFKKAWQGNSQDVSFLYANNYTRADAESIFSHWLAQNTLPDSLFTTSFALLQGVIDAILKKQGSLPADFVIATFGDNELLDFLPCSVLSISQCHKQIAETTLALVLNCLEDSTHYQAGLTVIHRQLSYRGGLSRQ